MRKIILMILCMSLLAIPATALAGSYCKDNAICKIEFMEGDSECTAGICTVEFYNIIDNFETCAITAFLYDEAGKIFDSSKALPIRDWKANTSAEATFIFKVPGHTSKYKTKAVCIIAPISLFDEQEMIK